MHVAVRMIVGMTLFAVALIASSWLFIGNPIGDWIDAALYIAMGGFFASQIILALRDMPQCRDSEALG